MELVNTNNENSFDPTPKLKSSPIPILFLPFDVDYWNRWNSKCFYCGDLYTRTLLFNQRYCKKCLSRYITKITDDATYLDMCTYTKNLKCSEHEISRDKELLIQNIQEWCENCSGVSYFKQIPTIQSNYYSKDYDEVIKNQLFKSKSEKDCKLCNLVYEQDSHYQNFKVCSNCYLISSGWIESTLTQKPIAILYLPWWYNRNCCVTCYSSDLKLDESHCQKYCARCCIIYTGCRYCLTTNIIFGFTDQSQCKKCKRISFITFNMNISSDDFLYDTMFDLYSQQLQLTEIIGGVKNDDCLLKIGQFFIEKRARYPELKLKSSLKPILFISFNQNDQNCFYCGDEYILAPFYHQKFCKKCLLYYITDDITDNNTYLDVICEHGINRNKCSNCYLISSGWVESTLTKKHIPILYLPWWDNNHYCIACRSELNFKSHCQKYCARCCIIYIGCRYCLATNIIFGFVDQSQCKKCKEMLFITIGITSISSGNNDLDEFLYHPSFFNGLQLDETISKKFDDNPEEIYKFIYGEYKKIRPEPIMEWIPSSQITDMKKIAIGGFGIIFQATWLDGPLLRESYPHNTHYNRKANQTVIVKQFENSQDISKYFLNELRSNQHCFKFDQHVIRSYGFTKDLESNDYMLVMQYASEGDLHNYLKKKFKKITWNKDKLRILYQISDGLYTIHDEIFIHRDFHSGNILLDSNNGKKHLCQIGDLGLSQPANDTLSNNEIYGVIPYIAPEIFRGSAFSKESDIYSFGMIMWELTTGCKPFSNVEHDHILIYQIINGKRPEITDDTPECFADLMKRCWDSDPKKRPIISNIREIFKGWFFTNKFIEPFNQAERKRIELMNSKKIGPEFTEKPHLKAIYTSRPLRSLISKSSSINSLSTIYRQDYISTEQELDIDILSSPSSSSNPTIPNFQHPDAIYTSRPLSAFISAATSSKKRKIEVLNIESCDNDGKYVKTGDNSEHKN